MKRYHPALMACILFAPVVSIAASAKHDFSNGFKACYAAANASSESKSACLDDELRLQSKAVADTHLSTLQALPSTEKKQFSDDFVTWKKTILLNCSLLADNKNVAIERENTRKYCLIENTIGRMNADGQVPQK